jgi:WD40 repeat protein
MAARRKCPTCGGFLPKGHARTECPKCGALLRPVNAKANANTATETGRSHPAPGLGSSDPDAARPTDPPLPRTGMRLGRVELGEVIARSPRAVVFAITHSPFNRRAVCKLYLEPPPADEAALRALRERLSALAEIDSPAIPKVFEIGRHEGRLFAVFEQVEGTPVRFDGGQTPLPPSLAAGAVEQLARALHIANQHGLVHAGLPNRQFLLNRAYRARLLGLDEPGRSDRSEAVEHSAVEAGARPPECAGEKTPAATVRSNVHSLGMLLHVLLTGSPPFRAATRAESLRLVRHHEVPSPELRNPLIPRELAMLTQRCLALEPARRPGTAQELAEDLARFVRSESSPSTRRPWRQRVARSMRRHPAASLIALLVTGGLVATGMVGWDRLQAWREGHATLLLEQAAANRLVGQRAVALERIAEAARIRPDAASRQTAIETLLVPELASIFRVPMAEACQVRFSADGTLVAIAGSPLPAASPPSTRIQPVVRVHDLSGGRSLGELPWAVDFGPVAFHPSAPWLAVPQPDGTTALWTPRAGQPPVYLPAGGIPLFDPDGQRLAIGSTNIVVHGLTTLREEARLANAGIICWADADTLLVRSGEAVAAWNVRTDERRPLAGTGQRLLAVSPETGMAAWLIPDSLNDRASVSLRSLDGRTEFWRPEGLAPGVVSPPFLFRRDGTRAFVGDRLDPSLLRVLDVPQRRYLGSLSLPGADFGAGASPPSGGRSSPLPLRDRMPSLDIACPDRDLASAIAGNGRYLAAAIRNPDPIVEVQDLQEGRLLASLPDTHRPVWSPDGRRLAVRRREASTESTEQRRDTVEILSLRVTAPNLRLAEPVRQVRIAPDGNELAAAGHRVQVRYPDGPPQLTDAGRPHPGLVCSEGAGGVVWGVDDTLVAGTLPLEIRSSSGEMRTFPKHGDLTRLAFTPDGEHLLLAHGTLRPGPADAGGTTNHFELWNLWRGRQEAAWPASAGVTGGGPVVYSPDGTRVASAFFQSEGFELIDAATGERTELLLAAGTPPPASTGLRGLLQTPPANTSPHAIRVLRFDDKARHVYAGTAAGWLCGVECDSGEVLLARPVADGEITALALRPKSDLVALSARDGLMRLLRLSDGEEVARWRGPRSSFAALEFGPQGRLLVAGSEDGLLQVWDMTALRDGLTKLGLDW